MNKDQIQGAAKKAVGKVQEKTGEIIGSPKHQVAGVGKQIAGQAQETYGDAKESFKDAVNQENKNKKS